MGALTSKPYAFLARSWELRSVETLDPFDSYLSKIRVDYRGNSILRILPSINEFGNQEWISDKIRFFYDAIHYQRISTPWLKESVVLNHLRKNGFKVTVFQNAMPIFLLSVSWIYALECVSTSLRFLSDFSFTRNLSRILPIHTFVSSTSDFAESSYLKTLSNKVGSNFNFNLSESFNSFGRFSDFRSEFNVNFAQIGRSDACILVSLNIRLESPVSNLFFRQMVRQDKLAVYSFFFCYQSNYLITNLGLTAKHFFSFLSGRLEASSLFEKFNAPSILIGSSFFQTFNFSISYLSHFLYDTNFYSKANFKIYYFPAFSSTVNSLELGFDREIFKSNICSNFKLNIFVSLGSGSIDFSLYQDFIVTDKLLCRVSDFSSLAQSAIFSIYIGSHGDSNASLSHIVFPAALPIEKSTLYFSLDSKLTLGKLVILPFLPLIRSSPSILNILLPLMREGFNVLNYDFLYSELLPNIFKNQQIFFADFFEQFAVLERDVFCQSFINEYFLTDSVTSSSQNLALSSGLRSTRISNFN